MFSSKKGMSPLVATVLLIAFAVALGAMIMNLSGPAGKEGETSKLCEDVSITTNKPICYEEDSVKFTIKNDGTVKIDGIQLIVEEGVDSVTHKIGDSSMIPGESIDETKRMLFPVEGSRLHFQPLILDDGEYIACETKGFFQSDLVYCS